MIPVNQSTHFGFRFVIPKRPVTILPLKPPPDDKPPPTPAPAWLAFIVAWLGLATLVLSIVLLFLPGARSPRQELEHARPYSTADRFFPVPVYASVATLFLGIVVFRQMREERRPLPDAMLAQRLQAAAGMALALIAIVIFYSFAAFRAGPK